VIKPSGSFQQYTWNNGATGSSLTVTRPGTYWLQVKDNDNCVGRDSIVVYPKECLKGIYVPTAFTPDGNGRNDYFKPFIGGVVKQYQFTIYNRWGQVVFTTRDLSRVGTDNSAG
jgi:hypothetical protein